MSLVLFLLYITIWIAFSKCWRSSSLKERLLFISFTMLSSGTMEIYSPLSDPQGPITVDHPHAAQIISSHKPQIE